LLYWNDNKSKKEKQVIAKLQGKKNKIKFFINSKQKKKKVIIMNNSRRVKVKTKNFTLFSFVILTKKTPTIVNLLLRHSEFTFIVSIVSTD